MEKQYKLFLAIISLWVVHKLVKHTHGYELFKGTIKERYTNPSNKTDGVVDGVKDGVKDGVTGVKDGVTGVKDGVTGVDDLTDGVTDGVKDGVTGVKDGVKDGVTGVDDLTGNTFGGVFAGMSFILLFFLGIFLILLPFLIFIRWIYLEITCKSCK